MAASESVICMPLGEEVRAVFKNIWLSFDCEWVSPPPALRDLVPLRRSLSLIEAESSSLGSAGLF